MTDTVSILTARVVATPDDDILRGVLADALDERGSDADRARARLIRSQVAADNAITIYGVAVWETMALALLAENPEYAASDRDVRRYGREWLGGLRVGGSVWERGFCVAVVADAREWYDLGDDVVRRHPVGRVRLRQRPPLEHRDEERHYPDDGPAGSTCLRWYTRWWDRSAVSERFVSRWERDSSAVDHLAVARGRLAEDTSPERILPVWWPGVKFTIPPETATVWPTPRPGEMYTPYLPPPDYVRDGPGRWVTVRPG